MTEDHVWNLVRRISASSGRSDLRRLADGLLQRRPVDNWPVQPGKGEFLKQALEDDFDSRDFDVIRAASTPYKVDGTPVYVHRANGQCDEASMLSELISSIHDKPESTSVLVVFNPSVSAKSEEPREASERLTEGASLVRQRPIRYIMLNTSNLGRNLRTSFGVYSVRLGANTMRPTGVVLVCSLLVLLVACWALAGASQTSDAGEPQ